MSLLAPRLTALARTLGLAAALGAGFVTAAHATVFTEIADAGQLPGSAQITTGAAGALTAINGSLSSLSDVDLYVINITSASSFSATTVGTGSLDTQIFLLTLSGAPIVLNDDDASGLVLQSTLPVGSFSLAAGQYIIGVAESGNNPMNSAGQLLFGNITSSTALYGPAPLLQPAVLAGYSGQNSFVESGAYSLQLTGASVAAVPEPATTALMLAGLGVLGVAARRRASRAAAPAVSVAA